jgi:hypothetical protein
MSRKKVVGTVAGVVVAVCAWIAFREYHVDSSPIVPDRTPAPHPIETSLRTSEHHAATPSMVTTDSSDVGVHFVAPITAVKRHQVVLDPTYVAQVKHDMAVAQMKSNFGDFIIGAKLTAAEAEQLLELLAEERQSALELVVDARDRGFYWGSRPDVESAVLAAATSEDAEIARLLGLEKWAQFEDFRDTAMIRMTLVDFNDRLVDQGEPLSDLQTRKLIQSFSAMDDSADARHAPIAAVVQVIGMHVTDKMIDGARSILSPSQLSALRALQIAQQIPDRSTMGAPNKTPAASH